MSELSTLRLSGELLRRAQRLTALAQRSPHLRPVAERLAATVVRPLGLDGSEVLDEPAAVVPDQPQPDDQWFDELWQLTLDATAALAVQDVSSPFREAVAGLQHLSVSSGGDAPSRAERRSRLQSLLGHLEPAVVVGNDGPYLTTNVDRVSDWLGQESVLTPVAALCRCGASQDKPLCDGSHATTGFSGEKSADRVPDRVDVHPGVAVTVRDNRGTCAHSGLCTDRLAAVFRLGEEPFVVPNGARMDEIVGAVRACPSGALSLGRRDGADAHDLVDSARPVVITVSKDGPYRVTGGLPLQRPDGTAEPRNDGASLEHYSLCRCGQSMNKPFCSGRHWDVSFRDPVAAQDHEPTLFEWAGGMPALLALTTVFYTKHVPDQPELVELFGSMSADHPEKVAAWLSEVFGGPAAYSAAWGGYSTMLAHHIGKGITEAQRSLWVAGMAAAADEAGLPADPEFRAAFAAYLEWGSRLAIENSASGATPPPGMPVPRWDWVCGATPGSRASALPVQEGAVVPEQPLPADGEAVTFEGHVKQLFRSSDRASMRFVFDLWDLDDVRTHGSAILTRLEQGSMPCDGAWPADRIAVFRRWLTDGAA